MEPDPDRNRVVWDTKVAGLVLVVSSAGTKSFAVDYRTVSRRRRRKVVGRFPDLTVKQARERARSLRVRVSEGADPLQEKKAVQEAPTLADLAERFVSEHGPRRAATTVRDYRRHFEKRILPRLGAKTPVTEVAWEHVDKLHAEISRTAPVEANRVLATGSKAWALAKKWGWLPRSQLNPWREHDRNPERRPGRTLDWDELGRLGAALRSDSSLAARGIELTLLTGARPGEWRTARWDQLDGRLLDLPKAKTGARVVFIGTAAVEVLEALPRLSDFVFPGKGGTPYFGRSAAWNRARSTAKLDARLYDATRHTFTSTAAELRIDRHDLKTLTGHAPSKEAHDRYRHPAAHPGLRARLLEDADRVAATLAAALRGEKVPTERAIAADM